MREKEKFSRQIRYSAWKTGFFSSEEPYPGTGAKFIARSLPKDLENPMAIPKRFHDNEDGLFLKPKS
jgi:hypothetical protein